MNLSFCLCCRSFLEAIVVVARIWDKSDYLLGGESDLLWDDLCRDENAK